MSRVKLLPLLAGVGLAALVLLWVYFQTNTPAFAPTAPSPTSTAEPALQKVVATPPTVSVTDSADAMALLEQRPLDLPALAPGEPCPTSKGSRNTVPPEPYIFCATCLWFGTGPTYLALGWHDNIREDATFSLDHVPYEEGFYDAKSPWVSKPDYSGPIRVRGRQLNGNGENKVLFRQGGFPATGDLRLAAYGGPNSTQWSFWPASLSVSGPGCYGIQIDTLLGSDRIIFEATTSASDPTPTP
ncbi:MAG: hypothetical protein WCD37_10300 [Chloroflexia bacterium]